jgi:uncharacterized membrane protein HdeD (DUF308 family)
VGTNFTLVIVMARLWWAFILRGILAIVFGVVALLVPQIALVAIVALFGAWALIEGVTQIIAAWRMRTDGGYWWVGLLEGIVSVAVGILVLIVSPVITAIAIVYLIGAWSIVTGALEIWFAIRLREQIRGELLLGLAGLLSILFGLYLVIFPGAGLLGLLWLVGAFAVAFGATLFLLGMRLRRIHEQAKRQEEYAERGI